MSLDTWSVIWQVVVAGVCVAFFGLGASVTWGAVRDARDLFRQLRQPAEAERFERHS